MSVLMAEKKKKGRASRPSRDSGAVQQLNTDIESPLYAAFKLFAAKHRPKISLRACIEWAFEEFLTKRGEWPPPDKAE